MYNIILHPYIKEECKMKEKFIKQVLFEINEIENVGYKVSEILVSLELYDILKNEDFCFKIEVDSRMLQVSPSENLETVWEIVFKI